MKVLPDGGGGAGDGERLWVGLRHGRQRESHHRGTGQRGHRQRLHAALAVFRDRVRLMHADETTVLLS